MGYILTSFEALSTSNIAVSENEFNSIGQAIDTIRIATETEEAFDGFIENYFELEQELLSITLRHMLFSGDNIEDYKMRGVIGRRLMNFMSSARSYLDYMPKFLEKIFGEDCAEAKAFSDATNKAYDGRFGYRVLEALRNYSQHRGYPWPAPIRWPRCQVSASSVA